MPTASQIQSTPLPASAPMPQPSQAPPVAGVSCQPVPASPLQGDLITFLVLVTATILARVLMGQSPSSSK